MICAGASPASSRGYFGTSSTLAFLESMRKESFRGNLKDDQQRARPPAPPRSAPTIRNMIIPELVLPTRATADHLIETYFAVVFDLFPVIEEQKFREEYENLWMPGRLPNPDPLWFCMLNCIFALASLFSDRVPPEQCEQTAESFYVHAKPLLNFDTLDQGSLVVVQALLLMGQYLQSTKQVNRCWYVIGLAIRIAQGLGLHLSEINNSCDVYEREIRKRCWWACLMKDTNLAMTFGRPMMIPEEHYDAEVPAEVDDPRILLVS